MHGKVGIAASALILSILAICTCSSGGRIEPVTYGLLWVPGPQPPVQRFDPRLSRAPLRAGSRSDFSLKL
jgi:hypothetical protein